MFQEEKNQNLLGAVWLYQQWQVGNWNWVHFSKKTSCVVPGLGPEESVIKQTQTLPCGSRGRQTCKRCRGVDPVLWPWWALLSEGTLRLHRGGDVWAGFVMLSDSFSQARGQKGLRPCCVSQVRQEAMWYSGEHLGSEDRSPRPSLSCFIDKMVLVKRLDLQGVASGSNEFTGVKTSWLWEVAETGFKYRC